MGLAGSIASYYLVASIGGHQRGLIGLPQDDSQLHCRVIGVPLNRLGGDAANASIWIAGGASWAPPVPLEWITKQLPCGEQITCAWLPHFGLVVLEPCDRIAIEDLLIPPQLNEPIGTWQSPPDAPAWPDRLSALRFSEPVTYESAFGTAPDQIGTQLSSLGDASDPAEPLFDKIKSFVFKKLDKLAKPKPDPPPTTVPASPTPVKPGKPAGGISPGLFSILAREIEKQRQKQLDKLLRMIAIDPDRALNFAIPLAGDSAFRGLSIPGMKLLSRLPEFSLGGLLGGGGPADFWNIDAARLAKLHKSYRDLANREIAAGRHRRAAYIYAHLLGDYALAAATLEGCGAYAEAAVLYRDKLRRPKDEARCLALGGMFEQAAMRYHELSEFELEGEALLKAGRTEEAMLALENAVRRHLHAGRVMAAADLIEKRFNDSPRAMELLWAQWPGGSQILQCIERAFGELGEHQQHQEALRRIQQLNLAAAKTDALALARIMHHVALRYPDRDVQARAEDQTRVNIAVDAASISPIELQQRIALLQSLNPADSLLRADASRFLERRTGQRQRQLPKPARPSPSHEPLAIHKPVALPIGQYLHMTMIDRELFAVRSTKVATYFIRFFEPADPASPEPRFRLQSPHNLMSMVEELPPSGVVVQHHTTRHRLTIDFPMRDLGTQPTLLEGRPPGVQSWIVQLSAPAALQGCDRIAATASDTWFGLRAGETEPALIVCDQVGQQASNVNSISLSPWLDTDDQTYDFVDVQGPTSHHLVLLDDKPVIAIGSTLIIDPLGSDRMSQQLPGNIHSLTLSEPKTAVRIVIAHVRGLSILRRGIGCFELNQVCTDRTYEHALLMSGGRLFAISDDRLYRFAQKKRYVYQCIGEAKLRHVKKLALLRLSKDFCGVAYGDGLIERY